MVVQEDAKERLGIEVLVERASQNSGGNALMPQFQSNRIARERYFFFVFVAMAQYAKPRHRYVKRVGDFQEARGLRRARDRSP